MALAQGKPENCQVGKRMNSSRDLCREFTVDLCFCGVGADSSHDPAGWFRHSFQKTSSPLRKQCRQGGRHERFSKPDSNVLDMWEGC